MKAGLMRAPAISEIYNQKLTYDNHLRKLERIREERKHVLNVDHSRHQQLQHLKDARSRTFANRFNHHNHLINQTNLRLLSKLETARPSRSTSFLAARPPPPEPTPSPAAKRRIIETEKENSRIFFRMRSVSSNLSRERLLSDYAKAEKIKSRITKYAVQDNKVALKSEKYFAQNRSNLSTASLKSTSSSRPNAKPTPASFYRKEDILRNKVVKTDIRTIRALETTKAQLPSLRNERDEHDQKAFFTTEPLKSRRVASQRARG